MGGLSFRGITTSLFLFLGGISVAVVASVVVVLAVVVVVVAAVVVVVVVVAAAIALRFASLIFSFSASNSARDSDGRAGDSDREALFLFRGTPSSPLSLLLLTVKQSQWR